MAPTAQEVALGWAIELITVSSELKGDAKMKILNALTPKLRGYTLPTQLQVRAPGSLRAKFTLGTPSAPLPFFLRLWDDCTRAIFLLSPTLHPANNPAHARPFPPSLSPPVSLSFLQIRMLLDALNLTTGSFTALDADVSQEVFETLITVGDRVRDSDRDRLPLPPSGLIADVYGETILSCLRGVGFDLALVRDRLEDYDVEDICRDSRWVGERELLNTRQSVGRLVASLRAEDDASKRRILLSGYRVPALILADLGAYVRSLIEALGPSFLETVAEDVAQGDYAPLAETVDGRPTGLLVPDDAREAARLTAAAATTAATAVAGGKRSRVVELARAAGPGSGGAGPSPRGRGKAPASNPAPAAVPDETAAPIARSKAAKAMLARANASVPDPLAGALAASGRDASGAGPSSRGGANAMWTTLNRHLDDEAAEETETEEAEEVEGDDDSNGVPSPAAVAAQRRKMNITAHRKPNATTVAWDEEEEEEEEEEEREGAGGAGADGARGAKRRYNRWSKDEIEALKGLVGEFGVGNWQDITREGKRRGEFKEHLHPSTVREKWNYMRAKATRK